MRTVDDIAARVRAEYLEMPGLRLKAEQVQRLCGIERTICQLVLDELLTTRFLHRKADGHYVRATDGATTRPHPAPPYQTPEPRVVRASWLPRN